jgi:hypothetical protein
MVNGSDCRSTLYQSGRKSNAMTVDRRAGLTSDVADVAEAILPGGLVANLGRVSCS